jgi:hypothetical protein
MLRNEVTELKVEIQAVRSENAQLIADMVYFNRSFEDFPWPVWQKLKRGDDFVVQYVNKAYHKAYLSPRGYDRYHYMGRTDFDIYDKKTARQFYARDLQIALDGSSKRFKESIIDMDIEKRIDLDVIKWRIIERKDTLVYGMVIPKEYE